jgi:diguanylate cyclase (GGDEF)-like protein/PAS domain S-box-containing protein
MTLLQHSAFAAAAAAAALLTALLSPILYFFLYRPLTRHTRAQAAAALQQSREMQLKEMINTSLDGFWMNDERGKFLEVNDAYCRMLGYSRDELLSMGITDVEAMETPEITAAHLQELFTTGYILFDTRHRRKDGAILDVEISATAVNFQNARVYCFIRDITTRKQAEIVLRRMEEKYHDLYENAPDMFVSVETSTGKIVECNDTLARNTGYRKEEIIGHPVFDMYPESYHDQVRQFFVTLKNTGQIHSEDLQLRCKDGSLIYVSLNATAVRDENGTVIRSRSIWRDISARKKAEEELQLAAMVYKHSSEAIAVTDANNRIIAVNPAFENMTGYSADEVLGKNPSIMSSGRHNQEFYQQMWQGIITLGHWQGEMWDKRKNGEIYAKSLSINAITNKDGSAHRHVALFSDITERKQSEELIWKQANFDTLTELPNRRMFLDRLAIEARKSERSKLPLALLLIDLDQFKEVNDTLGHAVGDTLLKEAAYRIRSCVRTSDTVARLGGDEFTVILSEIQDTANIEDITQKIIDKLAEYFSLGNEVVYISASVGITLYPNDASNIDDLMKSADQAMYVAKKNGRNRYSYYTHSLQESAQKRLRLMTDLRGALANEQLRVYFQPIINLASGRICKAEALIRWQHPERGMISPMDFIPLAEECGLIHEIGDWVFRQSAHWAKRWNSQFDDGFQISVNKSPLQFREDGNLYSNDWLVHLQELELSGKHIAVEITEGLLLNAEKAVIDKLLRFRDAGIQVALDDFGTGYSSLSYLKKFDIDYLKIDQSFVRNLGSDSDDLALCEAIIAMAHKLNLKVIAEGVETQQQRDLLAQAGCDYAQGYWLSRPLPPEELERYLRQR